MVRYILIQAIASFLTSMSIRDVGSGDRRLVEYLKLAEKEVKEIGKEKLEELSVTISMGLSELEQWDYKIESAISMKVTGESHMISNNASCGADAWRALSMRWAPRNIQRAWQLKKRCHDIGKATGYADLAIKV